MSQTLAPPTDVAAQIADALGETAPEPRRKIADAVRLLGAERVSAVAEQAREIDQGDGLLTLDGSRRRTRGGPSSICSRARSRARTAPRCSPRHRKGKPARRLCW